MNNSAKINNGRNKPKVIYCDRSLITAISLIGGSFPGLPIMLGDNVLAQSSTEATANLQFSYTKLGVLSGGIQRISFNSETKALELSNISSSSTLAEAGEMSSSQQASQSQSNMQLTQTDERWILCSK